MKESLGNILGRIREEACISVDRAARLSGIRAEFIEFMEADNFSALPSELYARRYLIAYAKLLELDETKVMQKYFNEQDIEEEEEEGALQPAPKSAKRQIVLTRMFATLGVVMLFFGVVGYIGWQLKALVEPPQLVIDTPENNMIVDDASIVVSGYTEEESIVTINGQAVSVDLSGNFEELVGLKSGVNTITISAKTKHSTETTVSRQILVERDAVTFSDVE